MDLLSRPKNHWRETEDPQSADPDRLCRSAQLLCQSKTNGDRPMVLGIHRVSGLVEYRSTNTILSWYSWRWENNLIVDNNWWPTQPICRLITRWDCFHLLQLSTAGNTEDKQFAWKLTKAINTTSPLPEMVKTVYDQHEVRRNWPSADELSRALQHIASLYTKVFILLMLLMNVKCLIAVACGSPQNSSTFRLTRVLVFLCPQDSLWRLQKGFKIAFP